MANVRVVVQPNKFLDGHVAGDIFEMESERAKLVSAWDGTGHCVRILADDEFVGLSHVD